MSTKTPQQIYDDWKQTLKVPDDSLFYYHPSLDRIILGLSMYEIASRLYSMKLGQAESLKLYSIYINEMVTAWIDDDGKNFDFPFTNLMQLCEGFPHITHSMGVQYPSLKKLMKTMQYTFMYWVAVAGDIIESKADELLDDITTDGKRIESEKISQLVKRIQPIVVSKGLDLGMMEGLMLIEDN